MLNLILFLTIVVSTTVATIGMIIDGQAWTIWAWPILTLVWCSSWYIQTRINL